MDSLKSNRAFKYGDGIFETFRYSNSTLFFIEDHFNRLKSGFFLLSLKEPDGFSQQWLKDIITEYLDENSITKKATLRIRISFWRDGSGLYTPVSHAVNWLIEHDTINNENYVLNERGLVIGLYDEVKLSMDKFSSIKKMAALPYVLASIHKKSKGLDDVLLVNTSNRIAEASSSNIFIVKDNKIFTPDLKEGPVDGVMRKQIIRNSKFLGLSFVEGKLTIRDFEEADEIFLCNVINGVKWVKEFELIPNKTYGNKIAQKFTALLNAL